MTLFLYIDLYFVLLFLSFANPSCICDARGSRRATRLQGHGTWSDGLEVPARGGVEYAEKDGCCWRRTANYKLYYDRLDNKTLDDTFGDAMRVKTRN